MIMNMCRGGDEIVQELLMTITAIKSNRIVHGYMHIHIRTFLFLPSFLRGWGHRTGFLQYLKYGMNVRMRMKMGNEN